MSKLLPLFLLAAIVIAFRILGAAFPETLPNFQPLPALLLCSYIFLKGAQRWALPLGLWIVTDPAVSLMQGYPILGLHHASIAVGLASVLLIAFLLKKRQATGPVLLATVGAALSFHFLTNSFSFFVDPLYPKNVAGFVQAQWTGPVGFAPTWLFLRNLLGANLLFTGLFLVALRAPGVLPAPQPARA